MSPEQILEQLERDIKELIITSLELEDMTVDDILSEEALFNEGLGLDSIDALELGMAIQRKYKVKIDAQDTQVKEHFASVKNLALFVSREQIEVCS